MDESSCREACQKLKFPLATPESEKILGSNPCYKNWENKCLQNGKHGVSASLICKRIKPSSGKNFKNVGSMIKIMINC